MDRDAKVLSDTKWEGDQKVTGSVWESSRSTKKKNNTFHCVLNSPSRVSHHSQHPPSRSQSNHHPKPTAHNNHRPSRLACRRRRARKCRAVAPSPTARSIRTVARRKLQRQITELAGEPARQRPSDRLQVRRHLGHGRRDESVGSGANVPALLLHDAAQVGLLDLRLLGDEVGAELGAQLLHRAQRRLQRDGLLCRDGRRALDLRGTLRDHRLDVGGAVRQLRKVLAGERVDGVVETLECRADRLDHGRDGRHVALEGERVPFWLWGRGGACGGRDGERDGGK